jgi:hypothetical protein
MTFSISQMIVDGDQNVVALNWAYTNADGTLSNQLKLATPYGDVALPAVTQELAVEWLEEQLGNTAEEFDAAIAKRKAESEYAQTLVPYVSDGAGAFQVYVEPEPEPELEAAVMPAGRKAKTKK